MSDLPAEQSDEGVVVLQTARGPIDVDASIASLVACLNAAGFETIASCSGHGYRPGNIALRDGRELIIARDFTEGRKIDSLFPLDASGTSVLWHCKTCSSPRAINPCPKCGSSLRRPAKGWEWPGLPDIDRIRELAREVGYAVGVHGSLERDFDLIAVPWVAEAVAPLALAQHIAEGLGGEVVDYKTQDKPCGRWSCNIHTPDWTKLIDLSVMTPALMPGGDVAPVTGQWQPIETAPKDGTEIFVWGSCEASAYSRPRIGCDDVERVAWDGHGWCVTSIQVDGAWVCGATHWRPLPTPPLIAKEAA